MYWDIPVLNELGFPTSKKEILKSLEEICYFAPELYNTLRTWKVHDVHCTTKFQTRETGRVFVVGIYRFGENVLFDPSHFDQIPEGPEKIVISIPDDIYTKEPWQFFRDHLEPAIISLFERDSDEDVLKMVENIRRFSTSKIMEKLNAEVWWEFQDRETIKIVIDLFDEELITEVFQQVISNLLQNDESLLWERELKRERYNSIKVSGLDPTVLPEDFAPPMVWILKKSATIKSQFRALLANLSELQIKHSSNFAISYILHRKVGSPDELRISLDPLDSQPKEEDHNVLSGVLSRAAESVEGGFFEYEIKQIENGYKAKMVLYEFNAMCEFLR